MTRRHVLFSPSQWVRRSAPWSAAILLAGSLLTGCNNKSGDTGTSTPGGNAPGHAAGNAIQGAGATFPKPIYEKWFASYDQQTKTQVNYQAIGSGGGYNALKEKTVDFAASDAPLSDQEESALSGKVVHIPTVGGAVVLTYNLPGVTKTLQLPGDVIADIFAEKVKTWNDPRIASVNPGVTLPATPIQSVHRTDGSGTTYIFTNYLKKVNPTWASTVGAGKSVSWPGGTGGKGNDGVAAAIKRTQGAIGYVELAFAIANKLPYASVKNHDGQFIVPSVETTTAAIGQYVEDLKKDIKTPTVDAPGANSYPICSLTYILMYKDGGRNTAAAAKLWTWALQPDQQKQAAALYYAPLPDAVVQIDQAAIQSIAGSPGPTK